MRRPPIFISECLRNYEISAVAYRGRGGGRGSHPAFTLIELLVTVAIVAILAALGSVAIQTVAARGKGARCLSNLRQLHHGIMAFAYDHQGLLPAYGNAEPGGNAATTYWHRNICRYVGSRSVRDDLSDFTVGVEKLYLCPADSSPYGGVLSYGLNSLLWSKRIPQPRQRVIVLADWRSFQMAYSSAREATAFKRNHENGDNYLFLDGHVEYQRTPLTYAAYPQLWDASRE